MSSFLARPLGIGELLDTAFQLFRRHFFDNTVIALAGLALPSVVIGMVGQSNEIQSFLSDGSDPGADALVAAGPTFAILMGAMLLVLPVWAALAAAIAGQADGKSVSVGVAYRNALRRTPALIATALLVPAAWAVASVIALVLAMVPGAVFSGVVGEVFGGVFAVIVFLVLSIGFGVWLLPGAFSVVPAVALEKRGAFGALRRSFRLARGARFRILGVLAVSFLLANVPGFVFELVGYGLAGVLSGNPAQATSAVQFWLIEAGSLAIWAVTTPFWVLCVMLLYYDRRIRTEALDLEVAAASLSE